MKQEDKVMQVLQTQNDLLEKILAELKRNAAASKEKYLTVSEAAQLLKCSSSTVKNMVQAGKIRATKRENSEKAHWLIFKDSIQDFLERRICL